MIPVRRMFYEIQELTHQIVVSFAKLAGVTDRLCDVFPGACDTHSIICQRRWQFEKQCFEVMIYE